MCLPLALLLMALPSLTGQTTSVPHLTERADGEALITWGNLWVIPVAWLALSVAVALVWAWFGRRRNR